MSILSFTAMLNYYIEINMRNVVVSGKIREITLEDELEIFLFYFYLEKQR
jgi:hypothetical protein